MNKAITLPSGKTFILRHMPGWEKPSFVVVSKLSAYKRRQRLEQSMGNGWTPEEWSTLLAKYCHRCLKCGSSSRLVPDHVIPMKRGGRHHIDNIQPLCSDCNIRKGLTIVDYRGHELPSASDLDAVAEEQRIKELTNGSATEKIGWAISANQHI